MSINKSITFIHISRFALVSKSTSFTFFIWIFAYIITFFHGRFVYIHTFFHRKIMCGCRLITCLYDIRQTSYDRRLHHSHVVPSVLIWAEFAPILGNIYPQLIRAATFVLSRHACPVCLRSAAAIIYRHILLGENSFDIIRTRTWENPGRFFRAEPLYVLYIAGKNGKNCNVRSCLCALDPADFSLHFDKVWWQLEPSNRICKKM